MSILVKDQEKIFLKNDIKKKSNDMKLYFVILVVYCLTHGFMLFLTGTFWDDWCYYLRDINQMKEIAMQTGRPEWSVLLPAVWGLPFYGYRKISFILYLFDALLFYNILLKSEFFSKKESLLTTVIYILVPVNDARVLLSNFSYAVGLTLFLLSFYIFIMWYKKENKIFKLLIRVVLWGLFGLSFVLNSNFCLFYSIFIFLFFAQLTNVNETINIKIIAKTVVSMLGKYLDFFMLPIIFFFIKAVCFPVYGRYENYNQVSTEKVLSAIVKMPIVIIKTSFEVCHNWLTAVSAKVIILLIIGGVLFLLMRRAKCDLQLQRNYVRLKVVVGLAIMYLSLFSYEVIRNGNEIASYGIGGRDAILFPLGFSILIASLISCLDFRKQKVAVWAICVMGIVYFNSVYFTWQEDYYKQLALIHELSDNDYVAENNTFYMINKSQTSLNTQRYYSLAWNSYMAFGDQSRIYVSSLEEAKMLKDKTRLKKLIQSEPRLSGLNDYDIENTDLDAVLEFDAVLGKRKLIKLKLLEICSKERFEQEISDVGKLSVFPVSNEMWELIAQ